MTPTVTIVLLWFGFAGAHLGLSSLRVQQRLVERIGQPQFLGLYSLLAFGFFVPLVWTYFTHKHAGPWLWALPHGTPLRWIMYVGMALAFVLMAAGLARPSPAGMRPGPTTPKGIQRITRHPTFMAFGLFGLLHLLPNGSTADAAFFGGFVVFTLIGGWHQDQRKLTLNSPPGFRAFYAATPFIPFTGEQTAQGLRELSPLIVGAGIAATIVVRYFHAAWFGG